MIDGSALYVFNSYRFTKDLVRICPKSETCSAEFTDLETHARHTSFGNQ